MTIALIPLAKAICGKLIVTLAGNRFLPKSRGFDDWICLGKAHSNDRLFMGRDVPRIDLRGSGTENDSDVAGPDRYASAAELAGFNASKATHRRRTVLAALIDALSKMPSS